MRVRIACHVHSDWSYDGEWSLGRLVESFSRRGYHVIMITEHDRGFDESRRIAHRDACRKASTADILLLPGIEYSDATNTLHLLVWGDVPFIGSGVETATVLKAAKAVGGTVVIAHPSRKDAWRSIKPEWQDSILGIELWNRKTDGWAPSAHAISFLESTHLLPFVGMDFHTSRQFFPLATVAEVEPPISEERVLASLRSRHCDSQVFGRPVKSFSGGATSDAMRAFEFVRRKAAAFYRRIISRRTSRRYS